MKLIACDRDGRLWALVATGSSLRARLVRGDKATAVMDLGALVDMYGPLVLRPSSPVAGGGYEAFTDIVDLVASDPETASVEQIGRVAAFAKSMVPPARPQPE